MIHRALKTFRIYHDLKQKELALKLGISASYLSEIESGEKQVNYNMLESYSEVFNIPISSIVIFSEESEDDKRGRVAKKSVAKALSLLEWMDVVTSQK